MSGRTLLVVLAGTIMAVAAATTMLAGCRSDDGSSGTTSARPAGADNAASQGRPACCAAASTSRNTPATDAPTAEAIETINEPPPPLLRLSIALEHGELYSGEPLIATITLDSPRAERAVEEQLLARQASQPRGPIVTDRPTPDPRWANELRLAIYRIEQDGSRQQVSGVAPAGQWLTALANDGRSIPMIGHATRQWIVQPVAELPPGIYAVEATLDPAAFVESRWSSDGDLSADARFELRHPADKSETAVRAERMALASHAAGRPAEVRKWAREAMEADSGSQSPQRARVLIALGDLCVANDDYRGARDIYRKLIAMPLPDRLREMVRDRLEMLAKAAETP